jgi:membrane protein required for colicin V production
MVDFLLIIFFAFCLIRGILRGTINEAISIVGILIGLIVASACYATVSVSMLSWIDNPQMRNLCGFLMTFGFIEIVICVLGVIAAYVFHLKVSGLGSRLAGAGVGMLKGVLLISVLLIPLVAFLPKDSRYIESSTMFSLESTLSEQMVNMIPEEMQKRFAIKIGDYKKAWSHRNQSNT